MKYKIVILLWLMLVISSGITVFAEDKTVEITNFQYSIDNLTINIEGTLSDGYHYFVNVLVIPSQKELTMLTENDFTINKYAVKSLKVDSNNTFSGKIVLPSNWDSGEYKVYVMYGDSIKYEYFHHVNMTRANAALQSLKGLNYDKFQQTFSSFIGDLALNQITYEKYKDFINKVVYGNMPSAGYMYSEFNEVYQMAFATAPFKAGEKTLSEILLESANSLDIVYASEYKLYSDDIKQELEKILLSEDLSNNRFCEFYRAALLLAELRKSSDYNDLQSLTLDSYRIIGVSLESYNSLNEYYKNNVFRNIFGKEVASVSAYKSMFEAEVENQRKLESESSSKNNKGGGGGGSHSKSTTYTTPTAIQPAFDNAQPIAQEKIEFTDLKDHWSKEAVEYLSKKNVVKGYEDKSFLPDKSVTRAEFIKMIATLLNINEVNENVFTDVSSEDWFCKIVNGAAKEGVILGSDGKINPNENITREDASVIIYRALVKKGVTLSNNTNFKDDDQISLYAVSSISALGGDNVINGNDGYFYPKNLTTRAEACSLIYKMYKVLERRTI